jgi:DNA topoisomerase IB
MAPLLRADLTGPGILRRRCGRGFRYLAADGTPLADMRALARVRALVIVRPRGAYRYAKSQLKQAEHC